MKNWKPIKGYEDSYEVSDMGEIRAKDRYRNFGRAQVFKRGKVKCLREDRDGYFKVWLSKEGRKSPFFVHRLVALAFIPNPDGLPVVNHIDGDKKNNSVSNLEWCTVSYNTKHAFTTGLRMPSDGGTSKPLVKLDPFTGGIVDQYPSISAAARSCGESAANISSAVNGRSRTAGGYKWAFVSEGVTTIESVKRVE